MSNYLVWLLLTTIVGSMLALAVHRTVGTRRPAGHVSSRFLIATLVVLFAGCAYGARLEQTGDINCQADEGIYIYGEFSWSLAPPGPTCTFTVEEHGFDEVRGPSEVMSVWLVVVGAGAATTVVMARRESSTSDPPRSAPIES